VTTAARTREPDQQAALREPLKGAYFWLAVFCVVYCARPEDWFAGLSRIPLAKISGVFALIGLALSLGRSKRGLRDFPRESLYLLLLILSLFVSALLSPVWRGGAFFRTLDFAKVLVAWALIFFTVTSLARLRRILFIQTASVALVGLVSVIKGHSSARLAGVLGGVYANPNDLAFSIVLTLPFCLAFLLKTRDPLRRIVWFAAILVMTVAVFLTASRAGVITLAVAGAVCLWRFGIRGGRPVLTIVTSLVLAAVMLVAGGRVQQRLLTLSDRGTTSEQETARDSYEQRRLLMQESLRAIAHHPVFGIGVNNFPEYSGAWRDVHVAYLQIAVEGGIPALLLYVLFLSRGFVNLRRVKSERNDDPELALYTSALYSSMVGFVVGAFFAPEAYHYFLYFAVAFTAVLLAIVREETIVNTSPEKPITWQSRLASRERRLGLEHAAR
jgi:O-antigen ligase